MMIDENTFTMNETFFFQKKGEGFVK